MYTVGIVYKNNTMYTACSPSSCRDLSRLSAAPAPSVPTIPAPRTLRGYVQRQQRQRTMYTSINVLENIGRLCAAAVASTTLVGKSSFLVSSTSLLSLVLRQTDRQQVLRQTDRQQVLGQTATRYLG